ncbi:pyridoxal-phosphate dependent enzyme [Brachybacterium sp. AOP25-B2-12]|uniref:pyridoxal-phosphate dependent enzyme n=1 Tax=Brachybacterium sp. AOP25-B2-12 TaxID=3457710 RepID=UPI0040334251
MTVHASLLEGIGHTPLVRLTRSAEGLAPQILVKVEAQNPGGSVKDRAALSMVRDAEARGLLRPGGTIIEATSGNTGVGLALVAAHLGYRTVIFASALISPEKIALMRAYGAEVRLLDRYLPRDHPESPFSLAADLAASTPGGWHANQFDNPANPRAHEVGTGPEIWEATDHRITHFVAAAGTGGTISGTARALRALSGGRVRVIAADPATSTYSGGDGSAHLVEGSGHRLHPDAAEDIWPGSFDPSVVDEFVKVTDREAIATARRVARVEGLLLGTSAGAALTAAFRLAERLGPDDRIVVIAPDTGRNGLSTYYDDQWLADRGFTGPDLAADATGRVRVRDLVSRPAPRIARGTPVREAREAFVAQGLAPDAPVLVVHPLRDAVAPVPPGEVIGVVTPAGLAEATREDLPIEEIADPPLVTVGVGRSPREAIATLDAGSRHLAVLGDGRIVGIVDRAALDGADAAARATATAQTPSQPQEAPAR